MNDNQSNIPIQWHAKSVESVMQTLKTGKDGLSDQEAEERLSYYGVNELRKKQKKSIGKMLLEQVTDVMVLILFGAAVLSMFLGEWAEAIVILTIVVIDAVIGVAQECKASNALEVLKQMSAPTACVRREGKERIIPASELVPGDIVVLEDGGIVPADLRLIQENRLAVQEASLTGESISVEKDSEMILNAEVPIGSRVNMVYTSSIVMYGNAEGVVVETGMNTEVGKIAGMLDKQDELDTPLKQKLNSVGKILSIVGLIVCIVIFVIGSFYGRPWIPLLMTAVSLAISIIPEGLPATATIVMALGVQRMAKQNAIIRKLPAVETLGSATVICCDKTGTLTYNRMTVTHIALDADIQRETALQINENNADLTTEGRELWVCSYKSSKRSNCNTGNISETAVFEAFTAMIFKLKQYEDYLLEPLIKQIDKLLEKTSNNHEKNSFINKQIADYSTKNLIIAKLHTKGILSQEEYCSQSSDINDKITTLKRKYKKLVNGDESTEKHDSLKRLIDIIDSYKYDGAFNEDLFHEVVKQITVIGQNQLRLKIIGDLELTETIERKGRVSL